MGTCISEGMSVGEVVGRYPQTRRVLEEMGLDYCCGGRRSLAEACGEAGLTYEAAAGRIEEAIERPAAGAGQEENWLEASAGELVEHITATHHVYMKEQLPRLAGLLEKVHDAHWEQHGEMIRRLQGDFERLRADIEMHLAKEEHVLFPMIMAMESFAGEGEMPQAHCGTVANPIRQMEREHDAAGGVLAEMREITSGYRAPEDACESFCALYEGLQELEDDLHQHIHLENNILFPKAVELEERVCRRPAAGHGGSDLV